jgi:hypothetical protein
MGKTERQKYGCKRESKIEEASLIHVREWQRSMKSSQYSQLGATSAGLDSVKNQLWTMP